MKALMQKILAFLSSLGKKPNEAKPVTVVEIITPPKSEVIVTLEDLITKEILTQSAPFLTWRETHGKNRSPQLDKMIRKHGGQLGDPYCIFGLQEVTDLVCETLHLESFLYETGSSQKLYEKTPVEYRANTPQAGFIAIFQMRTDPNKGHGAICLGGLYSDKKTFPTREFNTDLLGDRDGDGVFDRTRTLDGDSRLKLKGFIQWPKMFRSPKRLA